MKWILLTALLLFYGLANAEVIRVNGGKVVVRLNGKKVALGEWLDVLDATGFKKGILRVTGLDEDKAFAEIQSGSAAVGMRVARHPRVTVESVTHIPDRKDHYDIRLNPIGLIGGAIDANIDFKISDDWTVGVQGAYLRLSLPSSGMFNSNYKISAWGIGARANYFFQGALKSGWYIGPSLEYLAVKLNTTDVYGPASGTAEGVMASGLIGYGWFAQGFNIMVGGGYGTVLGASGITIKDSVGNKETIVANLSGLTYELSFGYAF